jgi:Arc/MetJ-type ribon-helix-helix transcriptional regulator
MPENTKRIAVSMTPQDRAEIEAAMRRDGFTAMSDYLRFAALRLARGQ